MCPFACLASGSGPTVLKSLVIALLAGTIGVVHSMASPLKLTVDAPPNLTTLLASNPVKPSEPVNAGKPAKPALAPPISVPPPAPVSNPQPTKPGDASMISLDQAQTLLARVNTVGDVSFVDARNPDEFVTGRIPSAFNMPPSLFVGGQTPPDLQQIPTSNIVVVYCGGGDCDASKLTAIRLREQGYEKVYVFEEGLTGWKAANLPLEK